MLDLADEHSVKLPADNLEGLKDFMSVGENLTNLEEYIARFDITLSVLQTPDALRRSAYELGLDCHVDGVRYLEVRYSPILHTLKGMTMAESVEAVKDGLEKAQEETGILWGIIICGIRHINPETSLKLADLTVQFIVVELCALNLHWHRFTV